MLRVALFLATNLGVLILASVTVKILGLDAWMYSNEIGINLVGMLVFCAIFGFGGAFISLLLSKKMAIWGTKTRLIEQPQSQAEQWLVNTVAELARKADIGMPQVGIFPAPESNAFATGWNRNSALVAVSEGMLSRFNQDEIKAVLAHEVAHVANGDMVTLSLLQGVVNTFVMFFARIIGMLVDRVVFKNDNGRGLGYFVTTIFAEIFLGIIATAIVMWFSRYREYRADAGGASLADNRSMINALKRLKQEQELPVHMPDTLTAFGIRQGMGSKLAKFFSSHPPLDARIAVLESRANQAVGISR